MVKLGRANFDPSKYSLIILKPDAMLGDKWGAILHQLAIFGHKPMYGRTVVMTDTDINSHYADHVGKDFFPRLAEFMKSGPSWVMLSFGSWSAARDLCASIRKDYNTQNPKNLIHASDSPEAVFREARLWFPGIFS